jgi:hypothetical protein
MKMVGKDEKFHIVRRKLDARQFGRELPEFVAKPGYENQTRNNILLETLNLFENEGVLYQFYA